MSRRGPHPAAALLALSLSFAAAACLAQPREIFVAPDSEAMRALRARPAGKDPHALLVAREALSLAGDERAVRAMDGHLAALAMARLAGTPLPQPRTIGDIADAPEKAADPAVAAAVDQLLSSTLRALLVTTEGVDLLAEVENAGPHAITEMEVVLRLPREGGDLIVMRCSPPGSRPRRAFAPGERQGHRCEIFGNRYGLEAHFRALRDRPGMPLPVEANSLVFADPAVYVSRHRVAWLGATGARDDAMRELRALDCRSRGACFREFRARLSLEWIAGLVGAAAGLVAGILVGALAKRRGRAGAIVSLAGVALVVAAGFFLLPEGGSGRGYAILAFIWLGLWASGGFLLALWPAIAAARALRKL